MSDFNNISDLLGEKKADTSIINQSPTAKFGRKMTQISLKEKEKEVAEKATALGLDYQDLASFPVSTEALRTIPENIAQDKKVVCYYSSPDLIKLGIFKKNQDIEDLAFQLGERHSARVDLSLVSQNSLNHVFKLYKNLPIIKPIKKEINITDEELEKYSADVSDLDSLKKQFEIVNITDILTLMVASALKMDASDIHVEAEENGIMVRYRIDGVLHEVSVLPIDQWKRFISRIKLLANLKINISDKPQDGRVTLKLTKGDVDVRVSTMPTIYGESVVMRILHTGDKGITFDELGLTGEAYVRLKREVERPNGMIMTTGPTGSGKTTTLYSILRTLNKPGVKIITLEDPIEIRMKGVNQSQVDASHNYTFAKGLKSILRQDPDICMVGEIRDLETAEIAIQASLTGHLMLSTIHTNDASGAIPRFLSMGVKPFLLAPALNAIIGQRLVRRVCPHCVEEQELDSATLQRVGEIIEGMPEKEKEKLDVPNLKFYHGKGCKKCSGLGYKGRVGIYEIFAMNKEVEDNILSGKVSEYAIKEIAIKNGMVTMVQDGILKALDKITTIEEIFRVAE